MLDSTQLSFFPAQSHRQTKDVKSSVKKKTSYNDLNSIPQNQQIKNELLLIPKMSINPNSIALYHEVDWSIYKPTKENENKAEAVLSSKADHLKYYSRTAEGKVSTIAKRKMNKALDYLLLITNQKTITNNYNGRAFKFKIAFITLTLPSPQIHNDNKIKNECLNQLLIELKKYYHVKNYLWRAEKQKNGNLHFHILVDKFIPYQELRDRWNRIINKLGYVDAYRSEMQVWHKKGFRVHKDLLKTWPLRKQKAAYERNSAIHWNSPNSTDVHSVQKIKNVKQYISKYLTKNEIEQLEHLNSKNEIAQQKGRIWSCNRELSQATGLKIVPDLEIENEIKQLQNHPKSKIFKHPYFTIIFIPFSELQKQPDSKIFKLFCKYLLEKLDYNWQFQTAA